MANIMSPRPHGRFKFLLLGLLCVGVCLADAKLHVRDINNTAPSPTESNGTIPVSTGKPVYPSPEVMITRLNPRGKPIYLEPPHHRTNCSSLPSSAHPAQHASNATTAAPRTEVTVCPPAPAPTLWRTQNALPVGRQIIVTIPTVDGDRHVALYLPTSYPERVKKYRKYMRNKKQHRLRHRDHENARSHSNRTAAADEPHRSRHNHHHTHHRHHRDDDSRESDVQHTLPALVLQFHGLNDECARFMNHTGFLDAAEREGFVVASACGTTGLLGVAWNAGTCCGFLHGGPHDVEFAHIIVDTLMHGRVVPARAGTAHALTAVSAAVTPDETSGHSTASRKAWQHMRRMFSPSHGMRRMIDAQRRPSAGKRSRDEQRQRAQAGLLLAIDPTRVMAMGFSNGGMLAEVLGCTAPSRFAAVVSISGVVEMVPGNAAGLRACDAAMVANTSEGHNTSQRPSVLMVHGDADVMVPWGGNRLLGFPPMPDNVAGWARRNNCTGEPRVTINTTSFVNSRYADCAVVSAANESAAVPPPHGYHADAVDRPAGPTSTVEVVRVRGGQHQWYETDEFSTEQYILQFGRRAFGHY